MMQGDASYLGIQLLNNAQSPVTPQDVQEVELTVEQLRRTYSSGQVLYEDGLWLMPLSQQETMKLPGRCLRAQVRVRWANGVVEGCPIPGIALAESLSREVI